METKLYLVGIPWDTYRIDRIEVFGSYDDAANFADAYEEDQGKQLEIQTIKLTVHPKTGEIE